MQRQKTKIQANGVDLGSDMLFGVRCGFSGTPSDLLPLELRPCHFEPSSEAQIVRVLTSTRHVSHERVKNWDVHSLLKLVADHEPHYHALIDVGALITGFSNEEVARHLLKIGLRNVDAVVFLDSSDRKMVVDRSSAPAVPLARSGVPPEKRFTFFDQVHTTGMDIGQALDARAVVTLGKDATLRDYSQGCYRMRGLGKGQTLRVLIVDEVWELIQKVSNSGDVLTDIFAWLCVNSMKSEKLQHLALCYQQLSNTWRKTVCNPASLFPFCIVFLFFVFFFLFC
jgi:hypothetical protein